MRAYIRVKCFVPLPLVWTGSLWTSCWWWHIWRVTNNWRRWLWSWWCVLWSQYRQQHREQHQAMEQTKSNSQRENLEECEEDMPSRKTAEKKSQECGNPTICHCRANAGHSCNRFLLPRTWNKSRYDFSWWCFLDSVRSIIWSDSFWYPTKFSYMIALGKVVAVNPWKVWEECTARRKWATGNLIHQTSHWQFNSLIGDSISKLQIGCSSHPVH